MTLIRQDEARGTPDRIEESAVICTQVPTMVDRIPALTKGHGPALPIVLSVPQATRRMRSKGLTAAAPK